MPWWAPLGGIVAAVAVFAGLFFIQSLGAGPVNDITITANILASLAIDHFGQLKMEQLAINPWRASRAFLLVTARRSSEVPGGMLFTDHSPVERPTITTMKR